METPLHRAQMNLLIDLTNAHWQHRTDYYVGGNMFLYYSPKQLLTEKYRGPDFFIVTGVDGQKERKTWTVWKEQGRYPDLIVELLSTSTAAYDQDGKKRLYERTFRTPEYYCYAPTGSHKLVGWRLHPDGWYRDLVPNERGWLWNSLLQVWLGRWEGAYQEKESVWLRFFDKAGRLIPTKAEAAEARAQAAESLAAQEALARTDEAVRAKAAETRATEEAEARALAETRAAEEAEARALAETRAAEEAARAASAEATIAQLQAELARLRG
jgi:Uma2 family endonuclease